MESNITDLISNISLRNSLVEDSLKVNSFELNFMSKTIYITSNKFSVDTKNYIIEQSDSYYHNKSLYLKEDHYYVIKIELNDYLSEDSFKNLFIDYGIEWKNNDKVFSFFVNFFKDFITVKAANLIEKSENILKERDIIIQDYELCFVKK